MHGKFIKICVFWLTLIIAYPSLSNPIIFEDFSDSISLNKFTDAEQSITLDTTNQNVILKQRSNSHYRLGESNHFGLASQTIESLQADLAVKEITLGNSDTQQAFIRLGGYFYKSSNGNVWGTVLLGDRGNGLEAWYEIQEVDATDFTTISTVQGSLATGLSLNTTYTSSFGFDGNKTFTFTFNGGQPVNAIGPDRIGLPDSLFKMVGTRLRFGHVNSTPDDLGDKFPDDGTTASITATLDNVITSSTAPNVLDDFSSANIDTTKWSSDEISNEIVNNQLEMRTKEQGTDRVTRSFTLSEKDYKTVGANITLLGSSTVSTNTRIRGRIFHYLGNDTYDEESGDSYNNREGDIFTLIGLSRHAGGFFSANIYTARQNISPAPETQIFGMSINLPQEITSDQPHNFVIEQVGTEVTYKVDGTPYFSFDLADTTTYPMLSGNLYPASNGTTSFRARIENDPGEVHVRYDDIIAYKPKDKNILTRAEIAKPLLQAIYGKDYMPPTVTGAPFFSDVNANDFNADWIEKLAADNITEGCDIAKYCPNMIVSKEQLSKLLLKAKHTSSYSPSPATGNIFTNDVTISNFASDWIEGLATQGISAGCINSTFCPKETVNIDTFESMLSRVF